MLVIKEIESITWVRRLLGCAIVDRLPLVFVESASHREGRLSHIFYFLYVRYLSSMRETDMLVLVGRDVWKVQSVTLVSIGGHVRRSHVACIHVTYSVVRSRREAANSRWLYFLIVQAWCVSIERVVQSCVLVGVVSTTILHL